ncbi:MAG: hypothetical protein ABSE73_10025 [Planctomycetota bacterium]
MISNDLPHANWQLAGCGGRPASGEGAREQPDPLNGGASLDLGDELDVEHFVDRTFCPLTFLVLTV